MPDGGGMPLFIDEETRALEPAVDKQFEGRFCHSVVDLSQRGAVSRGFFCNGRQDGRYCEDYVGEMGFHLDKGVEMTEPGWVEDVRVMRQRLSGPAAG